ncbi:cytochrome b/b6 domain-containing protein [Reyranella massiliensis]|uniref:cytochrome b/b6 domain-containing protein n=1 Tax=Reyranella massiliensis TaxID=445220 RepID=UPI0003157AA5|nr:cytochrome b/b6 domain-containing protein [Reyranella massiliensis]
MAGKTSTRILVWDVPVRLFHWTLAVLLAVSYFTARAGGDWMNLHFWSGYAILTLLFFRIAWGFLGSTTARFSSFLKGPSAALAHLGHLLGRGRPRDAGHNPLGGAMVVVLILAVLAQAATGLFAADTDMGMVNGPLALKVADKWVERATDFHSFWINVLLILVGLHVLAVVFYLAWKRQNLIGAMFTGRKPADDVVEPGAAMPKLVFVSNRLAISLLLVSAALVYFIVRVGG